MTARNWAPALLLGLALTAAAPAPAEPVGEVDTAFKLIGPDHKIVIEAYDDPKVTGVTCYVSRAKTGGLAGAFGVAEDKAEASIACRQVGPVSITQPLPKREEVYSERLSVLFKRLRVVRMVDAKRNTLVYLTYSDRVIEGSPQNSVTAVPVDRALPIPVR
jgi:CreA protein